MGLTDMQGICIDGNCKATLRLKTDTLPAGKRLQVRCPKCGTISGVVIPAEPVKSAPVANKTLVINQELSETQRNQAVGRLDVEVPAGQPPQLLQLKEGRNVLGRQSTSKPADIMINTLDTYMRRRHAVIDVFRRHDGCFQYVVSDCGYNNGTFINEVRRLTEHDQIFLKNGDCLRLGKTKLYLRTGEVADLSETPVG